MSKTLQTSIIVLGAVVVAAGLVLAGMYLGRAWWSPGGARQWGIRAGYTWPLENVVDRAGGSARTGCGSFGGSGYMTPGLMNEGMGGTIGPGMMTSGMMGGMGGMMGSNMMGGGMGGMMGFSGSTELLGIEPPSLAEVEDVLEEFAAAFDSEKLTVGEIMIFDNHAYAQIVEESTGIGAMEVLVDPVTLAITPEPGPNMMWNQKYGHMAGSGMMGGFGHWGGNERMGSMMGEWPRQDTGTDMPISAGEAVQIAQRHLDAYLRGAEADEHADPFYGYYTLHIDRGGETVGMLSVNGYSGQVFVHTWHGDLLETSEAH